MGRPVFEGRLIFEVLRYLLGIGCLPMVCVKKTVNFAGKDHEYYSDGWTVS